MYIKYYKKYESKYENIICDIYKMIEIYRHKLYKQIV